MKKRMSLLVAALVGCLSTSAFAGGYQLNEYSVTGLGRSFAGAGIVGDDYSAIAFNPAGMSLKKSGIQGGVTMVQLRSDVQDLDDSGKNPGTIRLFPTMPHFFAQYKVNNKWDLGFGIYTPYGLATKYKKDWFASDVAVESHLDIIDFAPAVSYKVTNNLTIGGTFIARYIHGRMTNTIADITVPGLGSFAGGESAFNLDGWTVSGVLGMMYEFTPETRMGFSWRLKSAQQVKGSHKIKGNTYPNLPLYGIVNLNGIFRDSTASPDLPETFTLSAFHKMGNFGLSGSAKYTRWSHSFEKFTLESTSPVIGDTVSEYAWKDSWTLTGGLDYYYNDQWTFRVGGGWDESPSHNKYTRTVRIPDNDRIWASCGFSYTRGNATFDVGYAHMFMKTTQVDEPRRKPTDPHVRAKYDSQSNILGVQMQYTF